MKINFTQMNSLLPFLMLGVGIDDMVVSISNNNVQWVVQIAAILTTSPSAVVGCVRHTSYMT